MKMKPDRRLTRDFKFFFFFFFFNPGHVMKKKKI
jgi:hypothetical protein